MMEPFRTLVGLPATGPWPEQFSATGRGTHREGFVVELNPERVHLGREFSARPNQL